MVNLADWGMYEYKGVLLQDLQNGRALQVRLEPGRDDVKTRQVPTDKINDVESDSPEWTSAAVFQVPMRSFPIQSWCSFGFS